MCLLHSVEYSSKDLQIIAFSFIYVLHKKLKLLNCVWVRFVVLALVVVEVASWKKKNSHQFKTLTMKWAATPAICINEVEISHLKLKSAMQVESKTGAFHHTPLAYM